MFAAPEQIVGDHIDVGVDLYAMGVILYLLFTHDRFPAVLEETAEALAVLANNGIKGSIASTGHAR